MKILFFFACFTMLLSLQNVMAQSFPSKRSNEKEHWIKSYDDNGAFLDCSVREGIYDDSSYVKNFVVQNHSDITMQKTFYKSGKLKNLGYYKLIYNGSAYCWIHDLTWLYFDERGKLKKEENYKEGTLLDNKEYN